MKFRKKLTREQFRRFIAGQRTCVVVFEAYGSAHYWAREMATFGHEVRLIAPHYVRPFVKPADLQRIRFRRSRRLGVVVKKGA
ncbi:MAG: hypothetical protein ACREEJ_01090 [Ensifer adhaerens]